MAFFAFASEMLRSGSAALNRDYGAEQRAEGKIEGKAEGMARAIVAILATRGVVLDDASRARISACSDVTTLDMWLVRAISAASVDDVVKSS